MKLIELVNTVENIEKEGITDREIALVTYCMAGVYEHTGRPAQLKDDLVYSAFLATRIFKLLKSEPVNIAEAKIQVGMMVREVRSYIELLSKLDEVHTKDIEKLNMLRQEQVRQELNLAIVEMTQDKEEQVQ